MLKTFKGFTLLEIMIVVLLIGIIAGFGIPSYNRSLEKSDEKEGEYNLILIHAAMENYDLRNAGYPPADLLQVDDINATLNLGIMEQNMDYDCACDGATFTCSADSPDGWTLEVADTDTIGTVRCSAGACPTL